MRHLQDLQVALRERQRRLLTEYWQNAYYQIGLVSDWIEAQPAIVTILAEAEQAEPNLDAEAFTNSVLTSRGELSWPCRSEEGQAILIWKLMTRLRDPANHPRAGMASLTLGARRNINDGWREFVERVLSPLFDFLVERVGEGSSILHVLERYVHIVEWFSRTELYSKFENNRATGEEIYNNDLQRFLYEDGGYITYAKVRSASGEADLTGALESSDPLICEGKLFDGRGVPYLASGLHQVVKYAHDQAKAVAYLVVFNLTSKLLQIATVDPPGQWPPYLDIAGVRVYLVVIRAKPPEVTASKSKKSTTVVVGPGDLTNPDIPQTVDT